MDDELAGRFYELSSPEFVVAFEKTQWVPTGRVRKRGAPVAARPQAWGMAPGDGRAPSPGVPNSLHEVRNVQFN